MANWEDMPPEGVKGKKSARSQESVAHEDIISNLPRDVMSCILGKICIREAVRTSVLSKKWRFNYLSIPRLLFDNHFSEELDEFFAKKGPDISKSKYCLFDEIVTKSLLLHPGGLEKFKVSIPYPASTAIPDVNKWILYLSWRNIKELSLTYKVTTQCHKLPAYFFSCLDLTILKLQNFVLSPPLEFNGFLNLSVLLLIKVDFANNCFESFISSCPLLIRLFLLRCSGIHHFSIRGPNLKELLIKTNDKFDSISLSDAPNLTEVSITLGRVVKGLEGSSLSNLAIFMGSLRKVKLLHLGGKFMQFLDETPFPPILSTLSYSLEILELEGVNFMDINQISAIVCLIRSAPNLQELYIDASTVKINEEQVSGYLKLLDCTDLPLGKLHLAELKNISSFAPEFEFIRFLLFSSPKLVTMSIL